MNISNNLASIKLKKRQTQKGENNDKFDFDKFLQKRNLNLNRGTAGILQVNVGKLCNLTCSHCHVNAGPHRKEIMTREIAERVLEWFGDSSLTTLDLTGGTPEMMPDFRYLVRNARAFTPKRRIMDRLNATIIEEPGYEWVAEFLAANEVEIIASLPCYGYENVDAQRGDGVFESSIKALRKLNALGYGHNKSLILNLVYNPIGASLPASQLELEKDYKRELLKNYGINFNNLLCLANMPIARFAGFLHSYGKYDQYMQLLRDSFNATTLSALMCRNTISVNWKGEVYDCDFNQMLRLRHFKNADQSSKDRLYLWDLNPRDLSSFEKREILVGSHCFGCTAGQGSSCGGALE